MKKLTLALTNLIILLAGIYIHIPFCKQACHYCDFHFSTSQKFKEPLLEAIKSELIIRRNYLSGSPVSTIYLGGGTPSLLSPEELRSIISVISQEFELFSSAEITLEANPDDLNKEYVSEIYDAGVNRLSIGIQSFQGNILKWMNRAHDSKQAKECIKIARSAGFKNISLDLIYGIPLSEHDLQADLLHAIAMKPDHISAYNLTIEAGTLFGHQLKIGDLKEIPEDKAAECFKLTMSTLRNNGYQHYEISNFSLPGKESLHNSGYWNGHAYLGVGPSAHSFNGTSRQFNIANNGHYLQFLNKMEVPFTIEELTIEEIINEKIMLGLRTAKGVDLLRLINDFQWNLVDSHSAYIEHITSNGFAQIEKNRLRLTDKGKLIADKIASDLFCEVP